MIPWMCSFFPRNASLIYYVFVSETFKEARERVKRALDESEWESSNTESFLPQSRLGRKVKKPSKFVNGAEVSDTERHGGNVKTSQSQKSSKSKAREKYLPVKAPPPVPLCPPCK